MIPIKSADDIKIMRKANRVVASLLEYLKDKIKVGITTYELDKIARDFILSKGAKPAFLGYQVSGLPPFPSSICTSVNSCIVHGIPNKKTVLSEGDIIGIDVGTFIDGMYGDGAKTYTVGKVSKEIKKLLKVTKTALDIAIDVSKIGNRIGDISFTIGDYIKKNSYFVANNLTGHGIGFSLHEDPQIPNSGIKGRGDRLKKGMTLAIEPMVNIGTEKVKENGWECFTLDGTFSAHYEHTIHVTDGEPEILTVMN